MAGRQSPIRKAGLNLEVLRLADEEGWTSRRIHAWLTERGVRMAASSVASFLTHERKRQRGASKRKPKHADRAARAELPAIVEQACEVVDVVDNYPRLSVAYARAMAMTTDLDTTTAQVKALEVAVKVEIARIMMGES